MLHGITPSETRAQAVTTICGHADAVTVVIRIAGAKTMLPIGKIKSTLQPTMLCDSFATVTATSQKRRFGNGINA
jgi:hypothetical protein